MTFLLIRHFAKKFAEELGRPAPMFSDGALQVLRKYHWPGNERTGKCSSTSYCHDRRRYHRCSGSSFPDAIPRSLYVTLNHTPLKRAGNTRSVLPSKQ